jgi:hypothetical protein
VWFQLAAELRADLPARLPVIYVMVTVAWPHVFARTGPVMPPTSAAGWKGARMSGLPEAGIARVRRGCQQCVP